MLTPVRPRHRSALRAVPEKITLPARDQDHMSEREPVRIFVGTEPAQYRAERVFLWSIAKHRDLSRVYEIYLMKELAEFDDRRWLTGFTNYRFAIPQFAGGHGRAIYNDVDQVYLDDPAKLFDHDLGDHAYLAVTPRDTSVMLMDCEKMSAVWTLARARRWRKNRLIDAALAIPNLYGTLDGIWNARDQDHEPGRSKCVHFTTIHKQPWRPFPGRYVYQPNPAEDVFVELENEATAAGFNVFNRSRPSARFSISDLSARVEPPESCRERDLEVSQALSDLVTRAEARTVVAIVPDEQDCRAASAPHETRANHSRLGLGTWLAGERDQEPCDGVVCGAGFEFIPSDDIPWVIDEIFGLARRFVLIAVKDPALATESKRDKGTLHQASWWVAHLDAAARRRTEINWLLLFSNDGFKHIEYRQGGCFLGPAPPQVWVLEDHKPGHTTQSLGLVDALGWPYKRIKLEIDPTPTRPVIARGTRLRGLSARSRAQLVPPWPDLVVASGARCAPVTEWIRSEAKGRTRTVYLGRKGANLTNEFDLAVAPAYIGLYPDSRRIETILPLNRVRPKELTTAMQRWRNVLEAGSQPRIALLVGGDDSAHGFDVELARRMGGEVATVAREAGGSVFVTTSRRTDADAARALVAALGSVTVHSYHWNAAHSEAENPYLGYLAFADILIVSGESASMLAEASATGKPLFIYPLAKRGYDAHRVKFLLAQAVSQWVMRRAFSGPLNRRGWERPQAGLELLCARLAARGWIRPYGDITKLHDALIARGSARYFDGELARTTPKPLDEAAWVAEKSA